MFWLNSNKGFSYRKPGNKLTWAWGMYAPFGGGVAHRDKDDPYRFGALSGYMQHLIYSSSSVSCAISKRLSVGISIGFGQRALGLETHMRTPSDMVALTRVIGDATKDLNIPVISQMTYPPPFFGGGLGPYEHNISVSLAARDDFVPSYNLGLLWRPKDWLSFGIVYQSELRAELSGEYLFEYSEQFQRYVGFCTSVAFRVHRISYCFAWTCLSACSRRCTDFGAGNLCPADR